MPQAPRPDKKAENIFYKVNGKPSNIKFDKSPFKPSTVSKIIYQMTFSK